MKSHLIDLFVSHPYAAISIGVGAASNMIWIDWLPLIWQSVLSVGGGLIVALTLWNKWLENKKLRKELNGD